MPLFEYTLPSLTDDDVRRIVREVLAEERDKATPGPSALLPVWQVEKRRHGISETTTWRVVQYYGDARTHIATFFAESDAVAYAMWLNRQVNGREES